MEDFFEGLPENKEIFDSFVVATSKLNNIAYDNILISVSGGSDSDILLDLCHKCDKDKKSKYVWFDTGLEYQATKDHIKYLEEKYDIEIMVGKPTKAIPTCCREYGQPFLSKQASEYIQRLQQHGFKWEDEPMDVLLERYCTRATGEMEEYLFEEKAKADADENYNPKYKHHAYKYGKWYKGCVVALSWWCNDRGEKSKFNIEYNKYLKEFMVSNPPQFKISNKCCKFAKKDVAHKFKEEHNTQLNIVGVRKAEGGARSSAYKNCFTTNDDGVDEYRPIFWYKEETKREYEKHFGIKHSECYDTYGLKRTGCVGCAFGRDFEFELDVLNKYEPKLYKAVLNIFKDTYEYTRQYKKFAEEMKLKEKASVKNESSI